jgi:CYTH domain-containing protein
VLAEVELGGRPRDVSLPAWLEPHVEREVTEDQAYTNLHLALTGAA